MTTDWTSDELAEALFHDYLKAVCTAFGCEVDLTDGAVSDTAVSGGLLSHALSRQERLAAFRLHRSEGGVVDTACVKVAPESVRIVVSQRHGAAQLQLVQDLLRLLPARLRPASRRAPSFVELAALLASRGSLATSTAEQAHEIADLRAEVAYWKEALREQADELRQERARTKDSPVFVEAVRFASKPEDVSSVQTSLSELPTWCAENEERITLLPRALNGAKKSLYETPADIFAGLEFLAGPYRLGRLGKLDKAEVDAALARTGLRMAGSASSSVAGAQGEAYFVQWRGRRRFLEMHLLKGGGRDERYCARIYFFWCDETEKVVVGSLPAHLDNSLT